VIIFSRSPKDAGDAGDAGDAKKLIAEFPKIFY